MFIRLVSLHVDDQEKARSFYTKQLGFVIKQDFPAGEFVWLTVVSPDDLSGAELVLEPNDNPAAKRYQESIHEQGIAATAFEVGDLSAEHDRLVASGMKFTQPPDDVGPVIQAIFDDTCDNLIQIYEIKETGAAGSVD